LPRNSRTPLRQTVTEHIKATVARKVSANGFRKLKGNGKANGKGKDRSGIMRCRVQGCKNRSKGPRFQYICAAHLEKLSTREIDATVKAWKAKAV